MMTHINGKTRVFLDKELILLKMDKTTQISKSIILTEFYLNEFSTSSSHILKSPEYYSNIILLK